MKMRQSTWFVILGFVCWLLSGVSSRALDLTGAWATDPSVCAKIFTKKGNKITFNSESAIFGGGFIVEGNQMTGQLMKCHIKSKEEKGPQLRLSAACLTDIMTGNMQFRAKVIDNNRISRIFPEMEDMEIPYVRCSL
jgi:hypothetical protein